ncbi:MAG: hypothetical protein JWN14_1947 [Chthonomonadales bacterium]|nr:hypothetical protein [Chthonomonadales bacterium]
MEQRNLTLQQKCGIGILTLTGSVMALLYWAFPEVHQIPLWVLLTFAAVGGAVGMALMSPRALRTGGSVCGLLMGLGSFELHTFYASFRTEMWNFESALVGFLGALPGILLYLGLRKWKMRSLSVEMLATGNTYHPDMVALRDDPLFVTNPVGREAAVAELKKQLWFIGCLFAGGMFAAFLILLIFSLSELSAAKAMPKCTVVSYPQFVKAHPQTGWYLIKECRIDLREAVYTVTPPEGKDPRGHVSYAYIPVHDGAGSKETNTLLLVSPANQVASTLYSQLEEIEAIREDHPTDAAEILNTHPERFVLKRDIQGTLATGATLYPTSLSEKLASYQPPLSHDFVVLKDGDNPSLSGSLYSIMLSTALCGVTLPFLVFMLSRYRRAKRTS